ncbi:MAG: LTA synthase family protein [Lachnospirales bacterium]
MKLKEKFGKYDVDFWIGLCITFVIALFTTFFTLWLGSGKEGFELFVSSEGAFYIFLYNFILVFFSFGILYFLTNNIVIANGVLILFYCLLTVINRAKLFYRGIPLYYNDIYLLKEISNIIKNTSALSFVLICFLIAIFIMLMAILSRIIKTTKINIKIRLGVVFTLAVAFFILNSTLLTQNTEYSHKGFLYSIVYEFNNRKIMPDYTDGIDQLIINKYENAEDITTELPTIIMIQGEAYSELGMSEKFNFNGHDDPYKNYKEIIKNSYYNKIVVPNFGGGTSDTEFDILTGMNTRFLRFAPYPYALIAKKIDALPSMLKKLGYYTTAIHPWKKDFYERDRVFKLIGFDEFITLDSFDINRAKGGFPSEEQTFERIINDYSDFTKKNKNTPYFSFNITIQNHAPFGGKYEVEKNFNTDMQLSMSDEKAITDYFVGIKDIDIELKKILDFFEEENKPVVVVYWSDHLPALNSQLFSTESMDSAVEKNLFENIVPFFIWENSTSKENLDLVSKLKAMNINGPMSDFYLPSILFDALGFQGLSYYIDYNNGLLKEYPILLEKGYVDNFGSYVEYSEDEKIKYYLELMDFRLKSQ